MLQANPGRSRKFYITLRRIDTLSRETTVKLFYLPSEKRKDFASLGIKVFPFRADPSFRRGLHVQESKHEIYTLSPRGGGGVGLGVGMA